ncbi:MAG: NAD-dependent epimerase/dehydratase family protein [Planctomycetia bacterium]|nr:NAD-dependent epimerase/dehydratase family protein [Planctomycetia bacterium]
MEFGTQDVLVTGGAGWLGLGLLHALTHGLADSPELGRPAPDLRVRALVLPGQNDAAIRRISDRIEIVRGDVRRPDDCDAFCSGRAGGVVIHTAGIIHPRRVREFYEVNRTGTANLLAAARRADLRRAVVVSSNSPCGTNPHGDHRFDEHSPYAPYMNYGRSKMLMERDVKRAHAAGEIETVLVRAPWFYGPFQQPRQSLFFRMVRDGQAPIVGGGRSLRSMAYIDNLCQGLILAASVPQAAGQVYWIADERPYTMNEVVDTIERLLENEFDQKCSHKRLRLPSIASSVAWLADWVIQRLGFYHQKIHVLSEMDKAIACSIDKAARELGYRPRIALEDGMRRSLAWCFAESTGLA